MSNRGSFEKRQWLYLPLVYYVRLVGKPVVRLYKKRNQWSPLENTCVCTSIQSSHLKSELFQNSICDYGKVGSLKLTNSVESFSLKGSKSTGDFLRFVKNKLPGPY